ncbi:MAG: efflux RND transporter periplasmic adaptor subunit [Acidobacteria bacterium]|nr:efflux RND transporter periplasmic adaptor subunit [Acidobacteriota bacterium]
MKKSVKLVIFLVAVVVVVGAIFISRQRSTRDEVTVEVETVEARDLSSVVEASGQIEPAVSVDISSDVIGRIIALGAEEGDRVTKGQFLVQVEPTLFQQRVNQLNAALDAARSNLQEVEASLADARANRIIREADFVRDKALYENKLVAASRYEASEAALHQAQAQVELTKARMTSSSNRIRQAQASRDEAMDQLEKCRIVSPMDGVVIRKNAEVGEVAVSGTINNQGSLLMTIADVSVMQTEIDVDETDVIHLELGQEAEVSLDAFPSRKFRGEVTRIGNSAIQVASAPGQRQSADYKVEVTLRETDPKIRPGLSATARITTATREQVISVPIQALVVRDPAENKNDEDDDVATGSGVAMAASTSSEEDEDTRAEESTDENTDEAEDKEVEGVFVMRDGKAVFVPVETGITGEKYFEVLDGLQEGDQVITGNFAALRKLKDDDPVKLDKKKKDEKDN